MDFGFRNVTFLKNTASFSFSPFSYFKASNLGKIDANLSWEIVTSSAVLDHRDDNLNNKSYYRKQEVILPFAHEFEKRYETLGLTRLVSGPSTRIRFHIVFIETANFSLHFHFASIRNRSKTMVVFTENDKF